MFLPCLMRITVDGYLMHSREGCYTYIKEVIKGETYIELSEEEQECLEKTIYQEEYDINNTKKKTNDKKEKSE